MSIVKNQLTDNWVPFRCIFAAVLLHFVGWSLSLKTEEDENENSQEEQNGNGNQRNQKTGRESGIIFRRTFWRQVGGCTDIRDLNSAGPRSACI